MALPVTSPPSQDPPAPSNMANDPPKRKKRRWRWRRMIRRVVPTSLTRSSHLQETKSCYDSSFKTSVAPSLGPFPDEHAPSTPSTSYVCDGDTPVEIACVSKPTGETPIQCAIEAPSSIDGSPIPPQQSLIAVEDPAIAGQCQGSDLSWTHDHAQLLRCPPRSVPDEFERVSQRFVCVGSETYSPPQPPPQVTCDDIKQTLPIPLRLLLAPSRPNSVTGNDGHCEILISDDSPSGGTNVSAIDPSPSSLDNGTLVTNTFTAELVPIITSFMHCPPSLAAARNLRGEAAQELIDIIDEATAVPELNEELRKPCLHLLYKMCKDCKTLPTSYSLQQGSLSVGDICYDGGFADVSAGDYLRRRVAVKRLRFCTKDGPNKVFKRFCQEIIVWKRLSHPNVLPLLGVLFSPDLSSFLMVAAWMQNGNVVEYTRSNPGANRLELLSGVMSGASYLHDLGIIHGDLKGANILVDDDGTPLLADFGLAAVSVDLNTIPLSATVFSSGGTIPWMSPELLFGQDSSPSQESDRYALGMVIYEVLTGHTPFHDLRGYTMLIVIKEGGRPRKPDNAGSLGFSDRLWELVVQCWDESPSIRPTAKDLLHCLQDVSPTWTPLEHPIPNGPDGEAGPDSISRGEQIAATDAPTSSFFVPLVIMLCAFMLLFY